MAELSPIAIAPFRDTLRATVKDILLERHHPVLERLAVGRSLLAFDYDGVLAPLVPALEGASMAPSTRRLLRRLARTWPCAVVTGRHYAKALAVVGETVPYLVGNHGYDFCGPKPVPRATLAQVRRWTASLARTFAGEAGVRIEEKRSTLAIHYAEAGNLREVERRVLAAVQRLDGARIVRAKRLVNILPAEFPNKGDAVLRLLRELKLDMALFLGDDITDEDVFAIGEPRVVGVHVGSGRSRAPYALASQAQVDELLTRLIASRAREPLRSRASRGKRRA